MKVRMYNVGCGDCFCLRDRKGSLLVDFGTSNNRIDGHPRSDIFDVIISDFTTISHKSLLLTNFQLDHISGLLYMLKKYRGSNDFNKIYLPDVFSASSMSRTLTLLLLSDLMKNTYLPSKQISLYAFVEALVKQPQNIEFLKRGDIFESKYQVLWPDCSVIEKETAEKYAYIQSLEKRENAVSNRENEFTEALLRLETFADKLRQIICGTLKTNAYALECEFRDLREDPSVIQML